MCSALQFKDSCLNPQSWLNSSLNCHNLISKGQSFLTKSTTVVRKEKNLKNAFFFNIASIFSPLRFKRKRCLLHWKIKLRKYFSNISFCKLSSGIFHRDHIDYSNTETYTFNCLFHLSFPLGISILTSFSYFLNLAFLTHYSLLLCLLYWQALLSLICTPIIWMV